MTFVLSHDRDEVIRSLKSGSTSFHKTISCFDFPKQVKLTPWNEIKHRKICISFITKIDAERFRQTHYDLYLPRGLELILGLVRNICDSGLASKGKKRKRLLRFGTDK